MYVYFCLINFIFCSLPQIIPFSRYAFSTFGNSHSKLLYLYIFFLLRFTAAACRSMIRYIWITHETVGDKYDSLSQLFPRTDQDDWYWTELRIKSSNWSHRNRPPSKRFHFPFTTRKYFRFNSSETANSMWRKSSKLHEPRTPTHINLHTPKMWIKLNHHPEMSSHRNWAAVF